VLTNGIVRDPLARTPKSFVFTSDSDRTIIMDPAVTLDITGRMFREEKVWSEAIAASSVCATELSQLPLPAAIELLRLGRKVGSITTVDIDVGPSEHAHFYGSLDSLLEVFSLADVAKTSHSVARSICGLLGAPVPSQNADAEDVARALQGALPTAPPSVLLVTHGGCSTAGVLCDGTLVSLAPQPPPQHSLVDGTSSQVRDSTGAGDAFSGGCLAWLHARDAVPDDASSLRDMIGVGNALGAICVGIAHSALPPPASDAFDTLLKGMHPTLEAMLDRGENMQSRNISVY
jgi:sugar/nucleoside kinase (ribokinase family)